MNDLEKIVLKNGLTIYLYPDHKKHSVFFQLTTFCGGITKHFKFNNKEYHLHDGIAHILEHYIVECNSKGNFLDKLGSKQMNTNASTTINATSFYFETVENLNYGINTLLEGIYNISFNKEKLEKIKNPIIQEVRGKLDNKFYHLTISKNESLFNQIDFKSIGGTKDEITNTTIDEIKLFYNAFYQPKYQFILIAGNFNKNKVLKQIKEFYKDKEFNTSTELIDYNEEKKVKKKEETIYFPTPKEFVDISFKLYVGNLTIFEKYDLDFLLNSLFTASFTITSPLHKKLVDNKIVLDALQTNISNIDKYIIISIGGYTDKKELLIKEVLNEINTLNSFTEERFELDKRSAIIRLIIRNENLFKMIRPLLNNLIIYDYPYLDTVEDIQRLTYKEFVKTIKNIDFSNFTITTIKNSEE